MKRLNILELNRVINEKKNMKREVYEKILSKCHRRIETNAENQKLKCFFEVPEYVVGYPLYDINMCIEFLVDTLKKNGFLVHYYFPKILYVSWDLDEISNKPKDMPSKLMLPGKQQPIKQLPTRQTKPLLTSNIQKQNGKITLNIT